MVWFRRKDADSLDPQYLLAQAQQPPSLVTGGFRMTVEDVFAITGRGTVVTGRVAAGSIDKGSTVRLTRTTGEVRDVEVTGIEMFRKVVDVAATGDNVGLLLRGIARQDVGRGDILTG